MVRYAQTNVQLYEQIFDAGYSDADLKRVREAYELQSQLLAAKFRANGKPEVAHLVGTASILAAHRVGLPVVLAGLLHNAYITGDFGSFWPRRMTRRKRQTVRRVIGKDAELLVVKYTLARWEPQKTASLAKALPERSDGARDVLLIRLANELEEAGDLFCEHALRRQRKMNQLGDYAEIARNMDMPRLAEEIQEAHAIAKSRQAPAELAASRIGTYHLPPLSYGRRLKPAISYALRKIWWYVPESIRSRFRSWSQNRALKID